MRFSAVLVLLFWPLITQSQSANDCLDSGSSDAIPVCEVVIRKGNTGKEIFYKLVSSYYEENLREIALKRLNTALGIHKNDSELLQLKSIIETEIIEEEENESRNKKNLTSVEKGRLKIVCLTKESLEAMTACRKYLELSTEDSDKMETRMVFLETEYASQLPPAKPATPTSTIITKPAAPVLTKKQVMEIQLILNRLGYIAGVADGIPGAKTASAARSFHKDAGSGRSTLDKQLLQDLQQEDEKLASAEKLLAESRALREAGQPRDARDRFSEARSSSRFLIVPAEYEDNLDAEISSLATNSATTTLDTESPETGPTETESADTGPVETSSVETGSSEEQLQVLLSQIAEWEIKLQAQVSESRSLLDSIRTSAAVALGAAR